MKNSIYDIVKIITLGAPLAIYLFLSATIFNIVPDYYIDDVEIYNVVVEQVEENYFIYAENATYSGNDLTNYNEHYGFYIDSETIIKIDKHYYSYVENELKDIKALEIQKQTSYKLPITFVISVFAVLIVALIVTKKMQWYKSKPRLAVFLALVTITAFLWVVNTILGGMLNVFLIATISWGIYGVEYLVQQGYLSQEQADKAESTLLNQLKEALK